MPVRFQRSFPVFLFSCLVPLSCVAVGETPLQTDTQTITPAQLSSQQAETSSGNAAPTAVQPADALAHDSLEAALLPLPQEPGDEALAEAWSAYRANKLDKLTEATAQIGNHPLKDYPVLWELILRLKKAPEDPELRTAMLAFIKAHRGEYLGERSATDFLNIVGTDIDKTLFNRVYSGLQWNANEPDMLGWYYYHNLSSVSDAAVQTFLRDAKVNGNPLRALNDAYLARNPDWTWSSLVILLQKQKWTEARHVIDTQPENTLPGSRQTLRAILAQPQVWVKRNSQTLAKLPARTSIFVILRLMRVQPDAAADLTEKTSPRLTAQWRSLLWGLQGYNAVVNQSDKAQSYFDKAGVGFYKHPLLSNRDNIATWAVRAYLRAGQWKKVEQTTALLTPETRNDETWSYWRARALAQNGKPAEARTLLKKVAKNVSFYGKLASDFLKQPYATGFEAPSSANVDYWDENPSVIRARAFYRIDRFFEGHREWNWAMRGLTPNQTAELALYARKRHLVHRMINTGQRAGLDMVNLSQLYPMPHRQLVENVGNGQEISPAWIYGIIRQESRFMPAVSSVVGARGLMQIMPATAKWVTKKLSLPPLAETGLTEIENNLLLGSAYLKMLFVDFDNCGILATAAYNAGPARSRAWRKSLTAPMEGAVFAESIPFHETREYVKNVLSNTHTYAIRMHLDIPSFTEMVGTITPTNAESHSDLP